MEDFNDAIKKFREKDHFEKQKQLYKLIGSISVFVFFMIVFSGLFSCFYSIGPEEVGVIRRFGQYNRTTTSGLHFKVPYIEKVNKVKVMRIYKEEFGFRTAKAGVVTTYSQQSFLEESLMLTGDLNVLVVEWVVQFKIKDPVKFLFKIRSPQKTIRNISEAVMREVVGDHTVNEVLTSRRVEINQEVQDKLQEILDSYESGIQIVTVKLQDVNPPDQVKHSFNEVNTAKQEKEKLINQAWEKYNKVIPRAKGEAKKTISIAEGYSLKKINKSKGDAARFISVWEAYKSSKQVTKKRFYLETMSEVLTKSKKYVIDEGQKGILPLLNLGNKDIQ